MSNGDFDVDQLAAYLHLTPPQIARMADRGRLPGRKVQGEWRFSRAEVHHWLEEQIGASDADQLTKVESVLDAAPRQPTSTVSISRLCRPETMAIPLTARTRGSVIRSMCSVAASTGVLWDAAAMAEAVEAREQLHPTALESGVALMHPRRPQTSLLSDSVIALGICPSPIPFAGSGGQLTDVFFLICSYDDRVHLRVLARLSRMLVDPEFLPALRSCHTPADAHQIIAHAEQLHYDGEDPV